MTTTKTTGTTKPAEQATTTPAGKNGTPRRRPVLHAIEAAEEAVSRNTTQVGLPVLGNLHLPAGEELVFLGGIGLLAVVGVLEWPVAVLLGLGHTLATGRRNKALHAFGEALEEA